MAKIGINGFGRTGRTFLRALLERNGEIVAINDANAPDTKSIAYFFQYDSTYGPFKGQVCSDDKHLIINKHKIPVFRERDPKKIPWKQAGAEYILESTGAHTTMALAKTLLTDGVKKVLVTAPSLDIPMYVLGVNTDKYDPKQKVVSMSCCIMNCFMPLAKIIHDKFTIIDGMVTIIHSVTLSPQKLLDSVGPEPFTVNRSALQNVIVHKTGLAQIIGKFIPELAGRVESLAYRVPVANGSIIDFTVTICKPASYEFIKLAVKEAAECAMTGMIGYTENEIVSTDIIGNPNAGVFDANAGVALTDHVFKLVCWYDNEYGYSNKLVDFIMFMQKKDKEGDKKCKEGDNKGKEVEKKVEKGKEKKVDYCKEMEKAKVVHK